MVVIKVLERGLFVPCLIYFLWKPKNEFEPNIGRVFSRYADLAQSEMKNGNYLNATMIWGDMEEAVLRLADDVVCANHSPLLIYLVCFVVVANNGGHKLVWVYSLLFTVEWFSPGFAGFLEQDFYNMLKHDKSEDLSANVHGLARLAARHLSVAQSADLAEVMNGLIREKLGVIPNKIRSNLL